MIKIVGYKPLPTTSGLAQDGVFARKKSCRIFQRSRPREHL